MGDYNRFLKYNFRIENALCTSSVTLENPSQSPYKKVFSSMLLIIFVSQIAYILVCLFACKEAHVPSWHKATNGLMRNTFMVYTLTRELIDGERKVSAALNLVGIESHLRELNIEVPKNSFDTGAACFASAYLVWNAVFALTPLISSKLTIFDSVLILYMGAVISSQVFGYLVLLSKCFRIKQKLCNEIDIIGTQFVEMTQQIESGPYVIQRRVAWAEGSEHHRRTIVKPVEVIQNLCVQQLRSFYCMFVIWISLTSAVLAPMLCLTNIGWRNLFSYAIYLTALFHLAVNVSVVLMVHQLQQVEESYEDKLRALRVTSAGKESRREVRHLLLRHVHSSEPYNCYIFDVDITLVSTIIETTLFVVTTYFS